MDGLGGATGLAAPMGAGRRVLLYSHDTFGLGHLRRCRAIAQGLTASDPSLSALILTGSPIAGRFDFPAGTDHVRLPGVVKLPNGDYRSHNLAVDVEETVRLRAAIIAAAAATFAPDLIIVDKEPLGFRGEMEATLQAARARRARVVLGLRDVLDDPAALREEWERKGALDAVERFYDEIWVYGLPEICRPLEGLPLSPQVRARTLYTGYLRREAPAGPDFHAPPAPFPDYVLVTAGGGGDGAALVDWALSAYEADPGIPWPAVIVYGPFLGGEERAAFDRRAEALGGRVATVGFDSRIERLEKEARGLVSMGGYNTFCEILSLDKPAVIAPRTHPRLEQYIRAEAAERRGLVRMLHPPRDGADPSVMAAAIRGLADQPRPSAAPIPGLLSGVETIVARAAADAPPIGDAPG